MPVFHPKRGMVLMCDYRGLIPPEMTKKRPVVVVGEEGPGRIGTCIVVPLSTTRPEPVLGFHQRLDPLSLPTRFRQDETWAKCDMVMAVACTRLDRVMNGRDPTGARLYVTHRVIASDMLSIRSGLLVALHMSSAARHLVDTDDESGA